tara:strand:- start:33368 stop:34684 length:1317 start_codon:yes stop_codon:yes gene_type:complete
MSVETKKEIINQRNQVFEQEFQVELSSSCKVGNGIVRISEEEKEKLVNSFDANSLQPEFFIPASGSGSRMFSFLYQWLEDEVETESVKLFFNQCQKFPFSDSMVSSLRNRKELVKEMLNKYSALPKGLIPFHKYEGTVRTAFQEQLVQANEFFGDETKVHFTIQQKFEKDIKTNIGDCSNVTFSYQNSETDAYCFDSSGQKVKDGERCLMRPAGHGALLENLNAIENDIVLIKNIDNVQHFSKVEDSKSTWKLTIGLLQNFKRDLAQLVNNYSLDGLRKLNSNYQFLSEEQLSNFSESDFSTILSRPTRVCGMVINEGEPGGGPFWIEDEQGVSNQIIENSQISKSAYQQDIVQTSSHFNPVFIAVSKTDIEGRKLDLMQFRDDSKFFVVKKTHQGKEIFYRELPGLWNGGMSNWNTIFLEIPDIVFTPVKSVLDLLK